MSPSECEQTISSCRLSSQQITRATYALLFLVALTSPLTHSRLTWLRFLSTLRVSVESLVAIGCFSEGAQFEFSSSSTRRNGVHLATFLFFKWHCPVCRRIYEAGFEHKVEFTGTSGWIVYCHPYSRPLCLSPDREESKHIRDALNDARGTFFRCCRLGFISICHFFKWGKRKENDKTSL